MKYIPILLCLVVIACGKKNEKPATAATVEVPDFSADSAYAFVQKQVDFGPRVPNSEAHKKTSEYLEKKLKSFGAQVYIQSFTSKAYDGTPLNLKNIVASFNPGQQKR
ncbi:MAG TPA: glutamine cyclotransferase, partial [Cyclobacteriaceae bacterium]